MYRNLSKRVEVVTPILAADAKERLWKVLEICLRDRRQAWVLGTDGQYSRLSLNEPNDSPGSLGTHETLMELARHRSD
jgi:polyphosphate kinase